MLAFDMSGPPSALVLLPMIQALVCDMEGGFLALTGGR